MANEASYGASQVETLSANEVISCLWNKNATEKCRIGLADAVVYENSQPVRWYVTGKTGEIIKKRGVDMQSISQRWMRVSAQNDSGIIAILKQRDGTIKFLTKDAWTAFAATTSPDSSISSIHCFVKGNNQSMFRNNFELKDKLGRFATSTYSYAVPLNRQDVEPVITYMENNRDLVECRAASLKNIMDLATNTVLRYIEIMLRVKVLSLSIDYVIDTKSQLWMLWPSELKFARGNSLTDLNVPGLSGGDSKGRMGWAGWKYDEDIQEAVREGRAKSPGYVPNTTSPQEKTSQQRLSRTNRTNRSGSASGAAGSADSDDEEEGAIVSSSMLRSASSQVGAATVVLDEAATSASTDKRKRASRVVQTTHVVVPSENKTFHDSTFPDPFKCKGDFCRMRLQSVGPLFMEPGSRCHAVEKLFTNKEMDILRKDKNFNKMMEFGADGPGLAAITMKSILLARKEKQDLAEHGNDRKPWEVYPLTPRQQQASLHTRLAALNQPTDGNNTSATTAVNEELRKEQELNALLASDKDHRERFSKGMASYYDQVRVCGVCFSVYTLMDWARGLLGKDSAHVALNDACSTAPAAASPPHKRSGINNNNTAGVGGSTLSLTSLDDKQSSNKRSNATLPGLSHTMPSISDKRQVSPVNGNARGRVGKPNQQQQQVQLPASAGGGAARIMSSTEQIPHRRTWKDQSAASGVTGASGGDSKAMVKTLSSSNVNKVGELDDYLRGGAASLAARKNKEKEAFMKSRVAELTKTLFKDQDGDNLPKPELSNVYRGKVLFACDDSDDAFQALSILQEAFFRVHWVKDGRQALNDYVLPETDNPGGFDCVVVQRDLPLMDAFDVVKGVREIEKTERKQASANTGKLGAPVPRRHSVICFTNATTADDLKSYMKADMDGCVSYPVNKMALLNTVRAAIPHHLAITTDNSLPPLAQTNNSDTKVYKMGALGVLEGSTDSATVAAKSMSLATGNENDDVAMNGVVQIDADTRVPYMVLDASRTSKVIVNPVKPFFNLVVCHDLFDTAERLKIFMRPIVQRYLGMQVLLWNYPGQAFTEWREEQVLNNEYMAKCLNEVLGQVGEKGTKDFDTSRPFYIMGYGNGTSIASFYSAHYRVPNLRGLLSVNGWSYVDSYLAGIMHDCINIFQCSPASRPDLPVYFFSRFLFSKDYLLKVSVPLALNIYTAVHNPISLAGRIGLCKGVLQAVDVRPLLREIDCPVICIQGTQDSFSRPLQTEPFVTCRGGEVRSINKALMDPSKTCVVWVKSGHEVFQEARKQTQLLIEQILTGFHETHDIAFPSAPAVDRTANEQGTMISNLPWEQNKARSMQLGANTVEDKFIDNVLGKMTSMNQLPSSAIGGARQQSSSAQSRPPASGLMTADSAESRVGFPVTASAGQSTSPGKSRAKTPGTSDALAKSVVFTSTDPSSWEDYAKTISEGQVLGMQSKGKKSKKAKQQEFVTIIDPTSIAFDRQDNSVYGATIRTNPNVQEYKEVKEYMGWRLKRNQKRLQRLQGAARSIQGAFRAYLARQFVQRIRRRKAAVIIQRCFRGWLGKCAFLNQARRIWATQLIQKAWRGYLGRKFYYVIRVRIAAAANIQRTFRGFRARKRVNVIKKVRYHAASLIQAMCRRNKARKDAWRRRNERNASITIQRIFRGHLGKRKALAERDKYIFSKSQSQGIEFGRQMLLEHKLHATKLQSDVTLLTQEKVGAEEQVEALLEEISSFEQGVRTLEKEMHQLSKVEAEAAAYMDEESKYELREQKIRLDKEFGEMLGKISNRKDMLTDLEKKLSTIDKSRQTKEEELRTLERKLVVLLEEQQNELNAIKRKQDVRGALLANSREDVMKATKGTPGGQAGSTNADSQSLVVSGGVGGGGGSSGPSLQEKKQAAQLMQSTETLMKFGFMSMSMTYFSSLNMIKALRTVSAQDTVMAALADVHAQRAVGFNPAAGGGGGGSVGAALLGGPSQGKGSFLPDLKPGQLAGQEALRVSAWGVEDVAKWLQTISLGQYSETFIDAAIDGEFLYDINDDDLKNTLGIEHRLHRKKILNCVHRLKVSEALKDQRINDLLHGTGGINPPVLAPDVDEAQAFPDNPFKPEGGQGGGKGDNRHMEGPKISIDELFSLVRHSKFSLIKEALDYLPNKKFDKTLVQVAFVQDHGTVYADGYERLSFHINKVDEFGNSMLSLSCQNGNVKICKYLVAKGANPNHQTKVGQTPAHFAISFKFFELSQWLFDNGADDRLENMFGLTAYDGMTPADNESANA